MLKTVSVEDRLIKVLEDFIEDWGLDADIDASTRLVADLEFDSIDVIQFVVEVEKAFQNRNLGFQSLLMQEGRYIEDLSVGQITGFLGTRLDAAA